MTPEVIQRFVDLDQPVNLVWNDEEGNVCSSQAIVVAVELCAVTAAGNYIPVHAITSIGRTSSSDAGGAP